ncbi:MAG: hypothetical protein K0Q90_1989 [Paenibacillaceae bacterium]|jgi:hypothetical protein|nr:hypothetical protein [Paenibacillaceae bacterium]
MKELLIVLLLTAVIVLIYQAAIGGPDGMESRVKDGGGRVHPVIERLNP